MRDLFHRGGDEGGEAFPRGLSENAHPGGEVARGIHGGVVGECGADFRERVIEGEVVADECFSAARDEELIAALFDVAGKVADHPDVSEAMRPPVEDLTAFQAMSKVERRRPKVESCGRGCLFTFDLRPSTFDFH